MFSNGIEADEVLIRFWGSSVLAAYVGHVAEGVGRAGWVLGDEAETRALEDEDDNLGKQVSLEADCLTPRAASCRFQRIDEQERVIGYSCHSSTYFMVTNALNRVRFCPMRATMPLINLYRNLSKGKWIRETTPTYKACGLLEIISS
ncbi:hypothetical protein E4U22_001444 [Claviceps purpurea]|nr:hypothetical protein E4U11_007827 [Claviceps purpurea]KAG6312895.1 hypothetical protein E4U22_001444 [Claviceps purpurea]